MALSLVEPTTLGFSLFKARAAADRKFRKIFYTFTFKISEIICDVNYF